MDLSALGTTLPPGLADAERDMGDKFRAAALSITTLYKSSLGHTKQAYQVGYSACLADVLSTVQSSIGAGQDATQTLSRLMDWAEAREVAMAAFAAEEGDDILSSTLPKRVAPSIKQHLHQSLLAHNGRSLSLPLPTSTPGTADDSPAGPSRPHITTPLSTPSGSSPLAMPPLLARRISKSPLRTRQDAALLAATFNPSLPANLPLHPHAATMPPSAALGVPGAVTTGSKRSMQDTEMGREETPPVTPRNGRSKRRNMGMGGAVKDESEDRDREREGRRKGGRRGGGHGYGRDGHGHGATAI